MPSLNASGAALRPVVIRSISAATSAAALRLRIRLQFQTVAIPVILQQAAAVVIITGRQRVVAAGCGSGVRQRGEAAG